MAIYNEFPQTNFHELNLDWVIAELKNLGEEWTAYNKSWTDAEEEWESMKAFITDYFNNLDINAHLTEVIITLIDNGEFADVLSPYVSPAVQTWLTEHAISWSGAIDSSLSIEDMAADAKAAGDKIRALEAHVATDLFPLFSTYNEGTIANLNFAWNADRTGIAITGNSMDGAHLLTLYYSASVVPAALRKGNVYFFDFTSGSDGVNLQVIFYDADSVQIAYHQIQTPTFIEIPANAAGMRCALGIKANYAFDYVQDAPVVSEGLWDQMSAPADYNELYKISTSNIIHSDSAARAAFMTAMNKKAADLGINAEFDTPSGLTQNVTITPLEMLKLGIAGFSSPNTLKTWGLLSDEISVYGATARSIEMTNTYMQAVIYQVSPYGVVIGGKGGSLQYGADLYRAQLTLLLIEGHTYLVSIMGHGSDAYNNLYRAVGQIAYKVYAELTGTPYQPATDYLSIVTNDGGYCYIEVPSNPETLLNISPSDLQRLPSYYGVNVDRSFMPCSVTKILTCITADDYIIDRHVRGRVIASDIVDQPAAETGYRTYNDDYIEFIDMFKLMMVISHNNTSETLARNVGKIILTDSEPIEL